MVLGLRLLAQAGTLLLVARMLGPHDYGAFAGMAALAVMLGTLSTFGTHIVLLAEVSRAPEQRAKILPAAISTTLICGSLLFGLYLLLATSLLRDVTLGITVLVAIGAAEIVVQPLLNFPSAEHQGHGRIALSQLLVTLPLMLRLLVAVAIWLLHPTDPLHGFVWGYLGASVLALIISSLTVRSTWPALRSWRLPLGSELRHAAGYAVLNLTAIGPAELDKTLALKLLPTKLAGVYSAGARVIGALTLPVIAMMLSTMPRLFRESHTNHARSAQLQAVVFVAALTYSLVLAVSLWIIAPLFGLLFGPHYQDISDTIRRLTVAVPGMALRIAAGSILMTLGKPWMRVGFELTGLLVLMATSVTFIARFGASEMPLALACSEWAMAALGWGCIPFIRKINTKREADHAI